MNKYKIKKLKSIDELIRVIEFLKNGFLENDSYGYEILKYILSVNKNKEFFGFYILDGAIIYGAVLTPFQGFYSNGDSKCTEIYSLSSWYVHPKYRGIPALQLQKNVISSLKNSIITNYTPNLKAVKIFKALGFKLMKSFIYRSALSFSTFIKGSKQAIIDEIPLTEFYSKEITLANYKFLHIKNFVFKVNELETLYFCGSIRKKKFPLFKVSYFMVLWTSNDITFLKNIDTVKKFMLRLYKCFGIMLYSHELVNTNRQNIRVDNVSFLIKSLEDISYIPPIGSELSVGQY